MFGQKRNDSSTIQASPYLIIENGSNTEVFFSPVAEDSNPLHWNTSPAEKTRRPIQRSISDVVATTRIKTPISNAPSLETKLHSQERGSPRQSKIYSRAHVSLHTPRPQVQRAYSNSRVEIRSRYHDSAITSAALQRELIVQGRHVGQRPFNSGRTERVGTASDPLVGPDSEKPEPSYRWYARVSTNSDPDLRMVFGQPKKHSPDIPLKTCLKKKGKSTMTTPASEELEVAGNASNNMTLRRVKTVDFEEATKPLLALPALTGLSKQAVQMATDESGGTTTCATPSRKNARRVPSWPGTISTGKSGLADPAITRTDVHVIAIAPSWKANNTVQEDSVDSATPTMQIVESNNGYYEVVWDYVPADHNVQTHHRSSSASHSLQAVGSTAVRGLQRVNTKLTNWSRTWNAPSEAFTPTIVVFPDDDGRTPHFECAVEDDEDLPVFAPPNSQRTSAGPSRLPSRPASAPMTRATSEEDIRFQEALQGGKPDTKQDWSSPFGKGLVVPDPEVHPTRLFGPNRRMRHAPASRKLSNLEGADIKFCGHRDSVTLAHSRLIHSSDFSQVIHAHRDSLSVAKKRMHARNHAISAARDILRAKEAVESPLILSNDDASTVSPPTVKQHAMQALRSKASVSMLRPQQEGSYRHIRIVE